MTLEDKVHWTAPASHPASGGAGQRRSGVPGSGDLPRPVLSVAPAAGALWPRRPPSTSPPGPARPPGAAATGDGTTVAERRGQRGDLGGEPHRAISATPLAAARGAQHRAARPAAGGAGDPQATADRARAPRPADGRIAHGADAPHPFGRLSTASRGMWSPASPASWCVWSPSTSGNSRA
jgi:hypothetical protein